MSHVSLNYEISFRDMFFTSTICLMRNQEDLELRDWNIWRIAGSIALFSYAFRLFSSPSSSPFDAHTHSFSCLQYLHFLLKHICRAITFVTWPFLEKAICLSSCMNDLIFSVRSMWRPLQTNLFTWGLDSWEINVIVNIYKMHWFLFYYC